MKESKRTTRAENNSSSPEIAQPKRAGGHGRAALAGLFLVLEVYGPALNGAFVLTIAIFRLMDPGIAQDAYKADSRPRPALIFSYWLNYQSSGTESTRITRRMCSCTTPGRLSWAWSRPSCSLWPAPPAGSGAYSASSRAGCSCCIRCKPNRWPTSRAVRSAERACFFGLRGVSVPADGFDHHFASADGSDPIRRGVSTKGTLTLAALLLMTDYFWGLGGIRQNWRLYGILAMREPGAFVGRRVLKAAHGRLHVQVSRPQHTLFTSAVIWTCLRLFFLPAGAECRS